MAGDVLKNVLSRWENMCIGRTMIHTIYDCGITAAVWTSRPVILAAIALRFWWARTRLAAVLMILKTAPLDLRRNTGRPGEGVVVVDSLGGVANANTCVLFIDT